MINIDFNALLAGVTSLASSNLKDYLNEATADGQKLLESLKADIQTWNNELVEGKISATDLEFLIMAKKEEMEMEGLKQAGVAEIRIDQFKNGILKLIVKTLEGLT